MRIILKGKRQFERVRHKSVGWRYQDLLVRVIVLHFRSYFPAAYVVIGVLPWLSRGYMDPRTRSEVIAVIILKADFTQQTSLRSHSPLWTRFWLACLSCLHKEATYSLPQFEVPSPSRSKQVNRTAPLWRCSGPTSNATAGYQSSKPIGSLTMSGSSANHISRCQKAEMAGYLTVGSAQSLDDCALWRDTTKVLSEWLAVSAICG